MDMETKIFEGNAIRTEKANGGTVYAVADVLTALLGQEDGKKYWTKRKQRARAAAEDIAEAITRVRLPGADGKLRMTDAAGPDGLVQIGDEIAVERLEAFLRWHIEEEKPAKKPRSRGGRKKKAAAEAATEDEPVVEPVAEAVHEAETVDAAEAAPVEAPEFAEGAEVAPYRRKRSRGGRRKNNAAEAEAATESAAEAAADIPAAEVAPEEEPVVESAADEPEAVSAPSRRKRSRGGRKKNGAAQAEAAPAAEETAPVEEPAEEPAAEVVHEAETVDVAEAAPAPARRKRSRGGKKKNGAVQAGVLPAEAEEDKTKEKVQKAVTKAVAKAAAKAAVKAAEKVAEKVAERPREPQQDEGEIIRRAIGRRESMAVLIDADNAQLTKLKATMDELSKFGRIVVRKAYGDWKNPCLKNWESVLTDLAIKPEQQFAYTKGKNATDIALVIDAMDLLATGRYDTFAIISCDSDYTPLVMRLRETGAYVFGIGADKTPSAFVNACDVFINTRMFAEKKPSSPPTAALPDVIHPLTVIGLEDIFALMQTATEIHRDSDGWTSVSDAGGYIKKVFPSFRVKSYGYTKMADLVLSHPERFETKTYSHRGATILAYRPAEEE